MTESHATRWGHKRPRSDMGRPRKAPVALAPLSVAGLSRQATKHGLDVRRPSAPANPPEPLPQCPLSGDARTTRVAGREAPSIPALASRLAAGRTVTNLVMARPP